MRQNNSVRRQFDGILEHSRNPTLEGETLSELLGLLVEIVGAEHVLTGDDVRNRATHFWDASPLTAKALVKPLNTAQVSAVMKVCHDAGQAVVTHGGKTGLADGEKSTADDIILSLERMCNIESIDPVGKTITVQAGCVLQSVQDKAQSAGLLYGLDLGARGSCTIGGTIATNAGGLSVLRYGMTREQVLGIEAVLADGTILSSMNAMMKNNAGYDLKQLFIGSEGTLGVITRAVLRLRPNTASVNTALLAFENFDQVTDTLKYMSQQFNENLNAFEVLWNEYYSLVTNEQIQGAAKAALSSNYALYVVMETRGANPEQDESQFMLALESAMNSGLIVDAMVPQSEQDRADVWQIRENVDIVLKHQPAFIYDISLPIASMQSYLDDVENKLKEQWPDATMYAYGHLADSNLHVTVAPFPQNYASESAATTTAIAAFSETEQRCYETSNKIVFEPLTALGGSVSAEHGIGLLKKPYLHYSRTPEEIATMQLLKNALDAKHILNPGKIVN
jgi:FAD/FMN-containing dehydrogenase